MKKTLLLFLFLLLSFYSAKKVSAQTDVTFCVDISCFSSVTAPSVFGSFNGWNAGANPITDPEMDGTYCATISLPDGPHEYKFFFQEEGAEDMETPQDDACTLTTGAFTNRIVTVAGTPLNESFGWESCDLTCTPPPALTDITLCVNLGCFSSITAPTVFGAFNGWNAGANPVTDPDGDGIYCATIGMADGPQEYKFFFQEEGPEDMLSPEDDACTLTTGGFTNRIITVAGTPLMETYGWESCDLTCTPPPSLPEPAVPAPDPTLPQANVISMFSNVYTDVPVDTWLTVWSSASLTEIQIAGNDTKLYESVNFLGIETTGANLIDASQMDDINIDIWTPNMTEFKIKLVDFGADQAFGGGDDSEHELTLTPTQESWVTYNLPLGSFSGLASTENIAQLILSGSPSGSGVLYVDNVYYSALVAAPVELTSFSAKPSDDKIKLQWSTATEINNDHFILERSSDGRSFQQIAIINGFGNSAEDQFYQEWDERPLSGINYYRLTQVDTDGTETKSNVISALHEGNDLSFELVKKAINGNDLSLNYQVTTPGSYQMAMYDISGKIISTEEIDMTIGNNEIITNIPMNGVFLVLLTNGHDRLVEKIFK